MLVRIEAVSFCGIANRDQTFDVVGNYLKSTERLIARVFWKPHFIVCLFGPSIETLIVWLSIYEFSSHLFIDHLPVSEPSSLKCPYTGILKDIG